MKWNTTRHMYYYDHENIENIDHEDNYNPGDIWDGSDVFHGAVIQREAIFLQLTCCWFGGDDDDGDDGDGDGGGDGDGDGGDGD